MVDATQTNQAAPQGENKPEFAIQRVYVKDVSFESPKTPQLFLEEFKPEVKMEINTDAKPIKDDLYEVTLKVTVTVLKGEETAFLAEVVQGGLFALKNFAKEQRNQMLGSFCPNVLYPYARSLISGLTADGGFPALYLSPVNFDALYAQHVQKMQAAQEQATT